MQREGGVVQEGFTGGVHRVHRRGSQGAEGGVVQEGSTGGGHRVHRRRPQEEVTGGVHRVQREGLCRRGWFTGGGQRRNSQEGFTGCRGSGCSGGVHRGWSQEEVTGEIHRRDSQETFTGGIHRVQREGL